VKVLDMIWAEEAGVSVYVFEGEKDSRVIEIHGINDGGYEEVLARATVADFRRKRLATVFDREAKPNDSR
jgi:hypothetical protein